MMRHPHFLALLCLMPMFDVAAQEETAAPAETSPAAIYRDEISGFEVGDANALDVVKLLNDQFPNLKFSAEPTTNRIYCRVPESLIDDIDEFIHELAIVAAEHRHRQEKLRQEQMDKEAAARAREEELLEERAAKERSELEARYDQLVNDGFSAGITFSTPLGLRIAQTQLRHAELQLQKLLAVYGPNHPEVRNAELQIEALKHLQKPQFHLFDQYRIEGFSRRKPHPLVEQPAKLAEVLKQLRPDLDVKVEGTENGQLIFSGSETSVAEAERVIKALQDVTVGTNPATLQGQYEDAERSAAEVAGQLRDANSAMSPDRKRIAELRAHLTDSVQLAFELRLQMQQYQLERAEADLMTARARLIRREQIAEQIVKRRVEELENSDDTAWSPAQARKDSEQQLNTTPDNPDAGAIARSFGIWLEEVTDLSEYKTDYRGGIRITAVISNTPAKKAGIKAGDVLVGLATWETTSLADLAFVLKKFTESSDKDSVKFFVMRNGETMTGQMSIPEFASAEAAGEF